MRWAVRLVLAALMLTMVPADGARAEDKPKDEKAETRKPVEAARTFSIDRTATINGQTIAYTVQAGEMGLTNDKDEEVARIFSVAYLRKGGRDPAQRPVTFLFNGGPGSASIWLHMGVFGPRRIDVPSDGANAGAPPYRIVDNAHSILDVTDLVFIDPVGTGFSRVVGKGEEKDFLGVEEDARAVARFIRQWLTEHKRWNSPKYLGGESYGGTRTAAVARELADAKSWVAFNGLLIISGAIDFGALDFSRGNDRSYIAFLPTMAATAWYHDRVLDKPARQEDFIEEARRFAFDEYARALLMGSRLSPEERADIVAKLARFTGLSESFIDRANLRVSGPRFQKELLRDKGLTVGRFDTRSTGDDYDDAGEVIDDDPSLYGLAAAYTTSLNAYFQNELGIDMGREYSVLGSLGGKWNWNVGQRTSRTGHLNVAPWIGEAMRENTGLRVHVACGLYDLATPFFAKEIALANNGVPADRVVFDYYQGGHMMYTNADALAKMANDIRRFISPAS